jgi:hypothetical protein
MVSQSQCPPVEGLAQSMRHRTLTAGGRRTVTAGLGVLAALLLCPGTAAAHGPVDPAASSYLAKVERTPTGVQAKVVDGDQRMWMRVTRPGIVVVLDYRGAPYLRFSRAGVEVNESSAMYYLNQVPAETPPPGIGPRTPPRWHLVGGDEQYGWHDGRLHALASTALAPGASYLGRWTVPLRVNGVATVISGRLQHADAPSIVWFWPILVALACVFAGLRLRRPELDVRLGRGLALGTLIAFVLAGAGQQLHGRPNVSVGQLIVLALVMAFGAWGLLRLARRRHGWLTLFLIAVAAIWEGVSLIAVLLDGFVLLALPAFVARAAVVACLAGGVALLPLVFRIAERPERPERPERSEDSRRDPGAPPAADDELDWEDERAWEQHH